MAPAERHRRRGEQGDRNETVNSPLTATATATAKRRSADNDADTAVIHPSFDRPGPERRRHISNWRPHHEMGPGPDSCHLVLSSARLQQRPSTAMTPTELPCTAAHRHPLPVVRYPPSRPSQSHSTHSWPLSVSFDCIPPPSRRNSPVMLCFAPRLILVLVRNGKRRLMARCPDGSIYCTCYGTRQHDEEPPGRTRKPDREQHRGGGQARRRCRHHSRV